MPRPDLKNAHIRSAGRTQRDDAPSQLALDAQRLLDDPAFADAMERTEKAIIDAIAGAKSDGSATHEDAEREACRMLRTCRTFQYVLRRVVNGERLRLADFRAGTTED